MKSAIASAMVFMFVLTFVSSVFALPEPISKLRGGIEAVIKSPLDLPKTTMDEVKSSDFKLQNTLTGSMRGFAKLQRSVVSFCRDKTSLEMPHV